MTLDEFHNALRILNSLDSHELGDPEWWERFAEDPFDFFVRCPDDHCLLIWDAMVKRGALKPEAA